MAYIPNVSWSYHRVGCHVARILGGAKPADLPIEPASEPSSACSPGQLPVGPPGLLPAKLVVYNAGNNHLMEFS